MHRLTSVAITITFVAVAINAAATPITTTNTGSASVQCFDPANSSNASLVQSQGAAASASCAGNLIGGYAGGSANGLDLHGESGGPSTLIAWSFAGQTQQSITEASGTGQGLEEFDIAFTWDSLGDPGYADAQANVLYNGSVIWSEDHPAQGHMRPDAITTISVVDAPFTFGTPFNVVENVSVRGGFGDGTGEPWDSYSYADALLSVTQHDPPISNVPEPSYMLVVFGVIGAGVISLRRRG